jgi:hypothetical protein
MEIYIAAFAALLASLILAIVYAADRWEREPVELIQNSFLAGLLGQLVLVLAAVAVMGEFAWTGPWAVITVLFVALSLPFQLRHQAELDERFDGIVYAVALTAGAVCSIHLFNLPQVLAASPSGGAAAPGAVPDLRDLLILASSPEVAAELGQGLVLVAAAVFIGAVLGALQLQGRAAVQTAAACCAVGLGIVGLDLAFSGRWLVRWLVVAAAVALAAAVKRRSVFRDRPQQPERDLVVAAVKTVLLIFGSALLATVMIHATRAGSEGPESRGPVTGIETGAIAGPR